MPSFIATAVDNTRMALTTLVLIFIGGIYAYINVPKEENPDVPIPFFYINIVHEGISPEDAERLLVKPMETYLRGLDGLKELKAIAHEGGAGIIVEFDAGFDADQALIDVREEVDKAKSELPDETEEPIVQEFNANLMPIISIVLSGDLPERVLVRLARSLRDELESLPGVLEAEISGDREELLEVIIDPVLLESYGISQRELIDVVMRNNRLVAAGALDTGEGSFAIKVPGLFETADDVLNLPVKVSGDGVVTLADVTEVRRTFKDPTSFARIDGEPAVTLSVRKRAGENIIQTIEQVRATVTKMQRGWPRNVTVRFVQDESKNISSFLTSLQNSVVSAVLLVVIVVVAALGMRAAGLVAISIPGSFLLAILALYAFGYTVNQVVLFALMLAVGLLVDGAIVVTEYADRKMNEGLHRRPAYTLAAQRMAWPIISSTATTLAAFLPLVFWPGIMGGFMKFFPLTLIFTLSASLLMALVFLPTLGAQIGGATREHGEALRHLSVNERADLAQIPGITGLYVRMLDRVVRRPGPFLLGVIAVVVLVVAGYVLSGPRVVLFPDGEPRLVTLQVHARGNLSIWEKDALVREVEAAIQDVDGIENYLAQTGGSGAGFSFGRSQAADVIGQVTLLFKDWHLRPKASEIIAEVRRRTARISGVMVEPVEEQIGPVSGKDIHIDIASADPEKLTGAAMALRHHMEHEMTGLVDVEDTLPLPGIEWELAVDRAEAGRFGTDVISVGNVVQMVTNGIKVGEYRPDDADDEVDIRVRFPADDRTLEQLDRLRVQTPQGDVPVTNFVRREARPKVGSIERIDGERVLSVKANVAEGENAFEKVIEIQRWLAAQAPDPTVSYIFRGEDEEQREASSFLSKAFVVALFLMAIILLAQFNSFYNATLILTAVLLSTVGVLIGMLITGRDFVVVMSGLGIIALAGIVVNNNIVLIDTYDRLKKSGLPPLEAIVRTGAQRLRPVLLTTITTVVGLLPMVFELDINFITREISTGAPSSLFWVDLAIAIVFGLTFATVLTLVVTPCLLALRHHWATRRSGSREPTGEDTPALAPDEPVRAAE
ncbi:MAG: efflux RND transporter permease subunit [Alphaproteobacteria bacterium]|nr:MAG: efflux RND transporter permease subunit [Alphaproteobacteria bacterium]